MWRALLLLLLCLAAAPLRAERGQPEPGTLCSAGAFGPVQCIRPSHTAYDTCQAIEHFARRNGLSPGFFARLLWQESRFDPHALSPANAQGIAQFIPSTAKLRGLKDPYNPAEALEYSAQYLGELARHYGNQGLAAVAYNGGEARADGLIARTGGLALETINYVAIITGLAAETWRDTPPEDHDFRLQGDMPFQQACFELARHRKLTKYPEAKPLLHPWGVQMAFGTTQDRALSQFNRRAKSCAAAVGGETPEMIWQKSRASPRGGYWMARLGRNGRGEAQQLCAKLRQSGCICAVYKNR
ncbi:transglycosylase [Salipiger sp. CCB-MM3]|uniref:lytic transglycosylase domain-containing protein n=1 Tax=Salipiger sp. CCB-MM3 TaxID=1792508 RepID=UPI00080AACDF|nr:lytic transglycosylase domain-containing protein [Salipiger sp. CCB-MM3]ANT60926.1 transglycosylase [Salipiger sp. CCB-MM3]